MSYSLAFPMEAFPFPQEIVSIILGFVCAIDVRHCARLARVSRVWHFLNDEHIGRWLDRVLRARKRSSEFLIQAYAKYDPETCLWERGQYSNHIRHGPFSRTRQNGDLVEFGCFVNGTVTAVTTLYRNEPKSSDNNTSTSASTTLWGAQLPPPRHLLPAEQS
ncbi:Hypothetical protein UVM_LOCUS486 [uncultured virus]|nr:Hypothetical protein UVM_LOCUS486 [uncultured virus]